MIAGAFLLFVLSVAPSRAASTQVWDIGAQSDFLAGKFHNLSLSHEGHLSLGPSVETLFASDQPLIWAVAVAPDGSIYLGTGHEGRVYRVDPSGEGRLLWKAPEIEVFALAIGPEGTLYAGTSPNGKVYRLSADGDAETYFDPKETYIWSLAFAPAQGSQGHSAAAALFIGTGDQGKIYRVEGEKRGEVYFETQQRHVVSLSFDPSGRLLAGTDPNGVLYRIDKQGKAFALYDADLPEVRSLQVTPAGDIFAAAVGGGVSQMADSVPVSAVSSGAATTSTVSVTADVGGDPNITLGGSQKKAGQPKPVITISQPVITYGGAEKAAVLLVRPHLAVEKLWSSREENLVALSLGTSAEPRALFATDKFGRIYRLEGRDVNLIAQTDQEQVTQLVETGTGLLVTTAHSGKLLRLGKEPAPEGSYETAVRDTGKVSRWGRLRWRADLPEGAGIEFFTRSGNSARPDNSWSNWSPPIPMPQGVTEGDAPITSPAARYIQWKAQFRGGASAMPVLERVRVAYLPQNSPPVIRSIDVSTSIGSGSDQTSSSNAGSASAAESTAAFSITVTDSGDASSSSATSTPQQTVQAETRKKMTVSWRAEDSDQDALVASVSFRGEGELAWKVIKKDLAETSLSIDSDALADGTYWFRVAVSDRAANPPDSAHTTERISQPVLIDHTPPAVRVVAVDARASVQFEAADNASPLQSAEYSLDAGPWVPVYADDGIVDSRRESFTIRLTDLAEGEHLLTLRVRDRGGNAGLGKAVIP